MQRFLIVDKLNDCDATQVEGKDLRALSDDKLEAAMNGDVIVFQLEPTSGLFQRVEFIGGMVPNWAEVPEEG